MRLPVACAVVSILLGCGAGRARQGNAQGDAGAIEANVADAGQPAGVDAGTLTQANTPEAFIVDAGPTSDDCAGLLPPSLPPAVWNSTALVNSVSQDGCGLPLGNGHGTVAIEEEYIRSSWQIVLPSGESLGFFAMWNGDLFPQPVGFIAAEGASDVDLTNAASLDDHAELLGYSPNLLSNFTLFSPDPNGGLLVVGRMVTSAPDPTPTTPYSIMMFNQDASVRWGPVPLGPQQLFASPGVDLEGRSLVLLDGTPVFGAGTVGGIWFDATGAAMTRQFLVATGLSEMGGGLYPLISGGFAFLHIGAAGAERDWVGVIPSGEPRLDPAPSWLTSRPDRVPTLARGRLAYAMIPSGQSVDVCQQELEVVSAAGNSCGRIELPLDGLPCTTRDLRLGLDGTVMQMLPRSREPFVPQSTIRKCTARFWPAALQ
jgi:hypothetical protein